MSTSSTSQMVQQGPCLRAVIESLPKSAPSRLCRDELEDATVGDVTSAINGRLINGLRHQVEVIVAASAAQSDGFVDSVQVGIQDLARDLDHEFRQIGSLLWAISADEKGMDVPGRWS